MKSIFCGYNIFLLIILSLWFNNIGIIFIGILGIGIFSICSYGIPSKAYKLFMIISTIMFLFMLLHYYGLIEVWEKPYYAGDDEMFEYYGHYLVENRIYSFKDIPIARSTFYTKGYIVLLATIERLTFFCGGFHTVMPRVLNLYFWLSIVAIVFKWDELKLVSWKSKKWTILILALVPNALYLSSFVYRDVFALFLLMVSLYLVRQMIFYIKNINKGLQKEKYLFIIVKLVVLLIAMYYLYYTRSVALFILLVLSFVMFVYAHNNMSIQYKIVFLTFIAIVCLAVFVHFGGIRLLFANVTGYTNYLISQDYGLSGYIFRTPLIPFGLLMRIVYGLMVPFPGLIMTLDYSGTPLYALMMLLVALGTILQIYMLPYLFRGIVKRTEGAILFSVVYLTVILTTFTFRHFLMLYPFMALCIPMEIQETKKYERQRNIIAVTVSIAVMGVVYILLKGF